MLLLIHCVQTHVYTHIIMISLIYSYLAFFKRPKSIGVMTSLENPTEESHPSPPLRKQPYGKGGDRSRHFSFDLIGGRSVGSTWGIFGFTNHMEPRSANAWLINVMTQSNTYTIYIYIYIYINICHNKNSNKVPLFFKHHSFFVVDMVREELHLVGVLSRPKQGSSYDTNPNHALLTGNPSKLPYVCIKFDPPKYGNLMILAKPTLKICQETWPRFWWSHVIHMKPAVEIQRVSLNIISLSLFIEGLGFGWCALNILSFPNRKS